VVEEYSYSEKKIAIVLSTSLTSGVATNVVGHMAISAGAYIEDEVMGRRWLTDASGVNHRGISKFPVIITKVFGRSPDSRAAFHSRLP